MEKTAQQRGRFTRFREKLNIPVEKMLGLFSPDFVELMDKLRETDDSIREQAESLKTLLKSAQKNINRREYMVAVSLLGQFHEKVENIYSELSKLSTAVNVKHHEFLFGDHDPESIEYLVKKLGPRFDKRRALPKKASIEKDAGIADWWYNITHDRGKAMSGWEKSFPRRAQELKKQVTNMFAKSEALLNTLLSVLKELGTARATRKLEDYLKISEKFKQKYRSYDSTFGAFYTAFIKPYVDIQRDVMEKKELEPGKEPSLVGPPESPPPAKSKFIEEKAKVPGAPLPEKKPEEIKFPEKPTKEVSKESLLEKGLQMLRQKQVAAPAHAPEKTTLTEHDIEPTLISPKTKTPAQPTPKTLKIPSTPSVKMPAPTSLFEQIPTEREDIEEIEPESPPTMRSPVSPTPKEKPIQVSMSSYQDFVSKLNKLASNNPELVSVELKKFANQIKDSDPLNSEKLLNLSKNIKSEEE